MKRLLILMLLVASPAWSADDHDHDAHEHADHDDHAHHDDHEHDDHDEHGHHDEHGIAHAFELSGLHVVHPWVRATDRNTTLVFMEVENESDSPVVLRGGASDIASTAEIVGFAMSGDEERYDPIAQMPIQPGRALDFAPKALAIRLSGLNQHLEQGHHFEMTLLTSVGELEIDVLIEAEDATQHSHAGHSH